VTSWLPSGLHATQLTPSWPVNSLNVGRLSGRPTRGAIARSRDDALDDRCLLNRLRSVPDISQWRSAQQGCAVHASRQPLTVRIKRKELTRRGGLLRSVQ
jgi:hypothetical protein